MSANKKNQTVGTINPNAIKTRDYALVALINGATKGGAFTDRKKDAAKKACRKPVKNWD